MTNREIDVDEPGREWPMGTGMIYLAMSPWNGMWKNRHQLMSRFSREMPVIYVEPWRRLRQVRRSLLSRRRRDGKDLAEASPAFDGLTVLRSRSLPPVSFSKWLGPVSERFWFEAIARAARNEGITNLILWMSRPEFLRAVDCLTPTLSIYHIVDEYGGYTSQDEQSRQSLWLKERAMLDRVDLAIAVSPELVAAKSGESCKIALVENAVDVAAFDSCRTGGDVPADMRNIIGPKLGYCGLIGKRLNFPLLQALAEERAEWSLVLIGKVDERDCETDLAALRRQPNVHFLGEKPAEKVAAYVSGFDAGLLPYNINLETANISPLKMYDYLAAGLPVVSTGIPAARRQSELVSISDSTTGFIAACDHALRSDNAGAEGKRIAFARRNSWDVRVSQIAELIQSQLGADKRGAAIARAASQ